MINDELVMCCSTLPKMKYVDCRIGYDVISIRCPLCKREVRGFDQDEALKNWVQSGKNWIDWDTYISKIVDGRKYHLTLHANDDNKIYRRCHVARVRFK